MIAGRLDGAMSPASPAIWSRICSISFTASDDPASGST